MLQLNDGRAYLALPAAETGAGVVLLHAWWGLTDFIKALADRLAAEGFVVLAPDLFEGGTAATVEEAAALSGGAESDAAAVAARIEAAVDFLKAHPAVENGDQLGVVGFSFGAYWSLWLANQRPDVIAAVVVFYGTNGGGELPAMRAAFMGHFAESDEFEPREVVEALESVLAGQGLEATFYVYSGTGHWFFESDRPAYHAESARLSWERTLKFLRDSLG